jgi:hypothetical protein
MVLAFASLLLADAPAGCPAAGLIRFGGGAVVVRPVGSDELAPFVPLGPAPGLAERGDSIEQVGAAKPKNSPQPEQPVRTCPAVKLPIA